MGEWKNAGAFAAIKADDSVVTWGNSYSGGDSSAVAAQLDGTVKVVQVFSSYVAFAALRDNGSVVTWGDRNSGGDCRAVADQLQSGVVTIADIQHCTMKFPSTIRPAAKS